MRSLAFSLPLYTITSPQNQATTFNNSSSSTSLLNNLQTANSHQPTLAIKKHSATPKVTSINATTLQETSEKTNLLRRREALVAISGFSVGILVQPKHAAAASEGASCEFTDSPSGLAFCDKVVGIGAQASKGQLIKAHYVGKLENGKVFDSSYNRGKPLTFRVGVGEVIKGWDQGIAGTDGIPPMLAGGKRTLRIPPELAYGARGAGCSGSSCVIPPNSVLLFDVEFVGKV